MRLNLITVVLLGSLAACSTPPAKEPTLVQMPLRASVAKNFAPRGDDAKQASEVQSLNLFGGQSKPSIKAKAQSVPEPQVSETDEPYICIGLGCSCSVE